jgi:hypothetical protein
MRRFVLPSLAVALAALLWPAGSAAQDKALKPLREWRGSVADEALAKNAPANHVIADEKTFARVWQAWEPGKKIPEVDFKKQLVLVATTRGSRLNVGARLAEGGDLKVAAIATRDLRPGFRYHFIVIPHEGVQSVNGTKLGRD